MKEKSTAIKTDHGGGRMLQLCCLWVDERVYVALSGKWRITAGNVFKAVHIYCDSLCCSASACQSWQDVGLAAGAEGSPGKAAGAKGALSLLLRFSLAALLNTLVMHNQMATQGRQKDKAGGANKTTEPPVQTKSLRHSQQPATECSRAIESNLLFISDAVVHAV